MLINYLVSIVLKKFFYQYVAVLSGIGSDSLSKIFSLSFVDEKKYLI